MPDREPELVYDDGSDIDETTPYEDPPRDGTWVDPEATAPTPDEAAAGEFLGAAIDVDDDDDNGDQWGTVEDPALSDDDFEALS
jgi:hypothetical protein